MKSTIDMKQSIKETLSPPPKIWVIYKQKEMIEKEKHKG